MSRVRSAIVYPAARPEPNAWTTPTLFLSTVFISIFSYGNLHPKVLPVPMESNLQQYLGVAGWGLIIVVSYLRRPVLRIAPSPGFWLFVALYTVGLISSLWAPEFLASAPKAFALAFTSFGAYRLCRSASFDMIIEAAFFGQLILCTGSVIVAVLLPDIGVLSNWQHSGQWNGVFYTKQNLGILGALMLYFAAYRLLTPERQYYHWIAVVIALVCMIASGSRGGAGLAVFAVVCLYSSGVSVNFARVLAFAPFVMCLFGMALISYFVRTGNRYLILFGNEFDFTERTFIWQHALGHFLEHKWLGFGLNGFWTIPEYRNVFLQIHGWFLDNYHNGYITVAMETGLVGLFLLCAGSLFLGVRIVRRIQIDGRLDRDVAVALAYICLLFFIDFTETFFLRSTNMAASLLLVCVAVISSKSVRYPAGAVAQVVSERGAKRLHGRAGSYA